MYSFHKFVKLFLLIFIIAIASHLYSWNTYTKYVFPKEYIIGDLGRLSYQIDSLQPRFEQVSLSVEKDKFINHKNKKFEVVTIGDSFSDGGGMGLNTFYQYYISDFNKKNVLNLKNILSSDNYIETIVSLLNKGYFEKWGTKYIVLETVERKAIERLSRQINLDAKNSFLLKNINKIDCFIDTNKTVEKSNNEYKLNNKDTSVLGYDKFTINIFNNLNINALLYNIFYNIDDRAFIASTYKVKLNQELFTVNDSKVLLFYKKDLKALGKSTKENVELLNNNLNLLTKLLSKNGIKLYFMPVVDKSNLYRQYVSKPKYKESTFFENLRPLNKEYLYIDTKDILLSELNNGVKDIFYPDDSHWSYKASETVFKRVKFE
ncbi:hypothetical protein [Sulfurimonas sp.]|uniref:hypothetical protein n=1 Tax=Sulfurimonas sp. TaxID=2022749 RepID=UPI0035647E9E